MPEKSVGSKREVRRAAARHDELLFGVEIECHGRPREEGAELIQTITGGAVSVVRPEGAPDEKHYVEIATKLDTWKIEPDASLTNSSAQLQVEVVTPSLPESELDLLLRVVEVLSDAGLTVDKTCGIHVHIDGSGFDVGALASLITQTKGAETALHVLLGLDQERLDRYAKLIDRDFFEAVLRDPPGNMEQLKRLYYGDDYREDMAPPRRHPARYRGLSLNSYWFRGSIEFRHFPGSLHPPRVRQFVEICLWLAKDALPPRRNRKPNE